MLQTALQSAFNAALAEETTDGELMNARPRDLESLGQLAVDGGLGAIGEWLKKAIELPPRDEFQTIVETAYDAYVSPRFAGRPFLNKAAKALLVMGAMALYDAAAAQLG